jgi:hypothetical protein
MCQHQPSCPSAHTPEHAVARVVAAHPEQGWSLLCNGVVLFEDTGELLPDGQAVAPHRPAGIQIRSNRAAAWLPAPPRRPIRPAAVSASAA